MKRFGLLPFLSLLFALLLPATVLAQTRPIQVGRATWDTGWFQTEVLRQLIQELGYPVDKAKTVDANRFYTQLSEGEFDFWANGWLPGHTRFIAPYQHDILPVGYEVKSGALQGFMIDKKTAEAHKITSLADLKKPEIARLFDHNDNQKADLIGCDLDWACSHLIRDILDRQGVTQNIEQIQGNYSALMYEVMRLYRAGKPILFYTWTPNWTVGALEPGKDVVWVPMTPQSPDEKKHVLKEIDGCLQADCYLGFAPSDIRVVANQRFLGRYPAIRSLFEQVKIPMADISAQNALLLEGEDTLKDIVGHAKTWIEKNRVQVDLWLKTARQKMRRPPPSLGVDTQGNTAKKPRSLTVAVKRFEPFITFEKLNYGGFGIELWRQIAKEMNVPFEIMAVNSMAKLLDEVKRGQADVGISGIGITSDREKEVDFSHPFYKSGLQIMILNTGGNGLVRFFKQVLSVLLSPALLLAIGILVVILLIAAHVMWFSEKGNNPDFSPKYFQGIGEAVWWAAVTLTTVGYGDKTPRNFPGKLFALFWMFAGYFVFAYFTASVTSSMTVQHIEDNIQGPSDLMNKKVATVRGSVAEDYLLGMGVQPTTYRDVDEAYHELKSKKVDAVVFHEPVLRYYATHRGKGEMKMVGPVFQKQNYGFVFQVDSPVQEEVNQALLKLIETGDYDRLHHKWFGDKSANNS